jgi:hypothetical protein
MLKSGKSHRGENGMRDEHVSVNYRQSWAYEDAVLKNKLNKKRLKRSNNPLDKSLYLN